jgi:hypothetical protein
VDKLVADLIAWLALEKSRFAGSSRAGHRAVQHPFRPMESTSKRRSMGQTDRAVSNLPRDVGDVGHEPGSRNGNRSFGRGARDLPRLSFF